MGGYEQQIMQYSTGFAVCLGILIAAASLAVFFGIRFRILRIVILRIGSRRRSGGERKKKNGHGASAFLLPQQEKEYEKTAPIKGRMESGTEETKGSRL